MKEPEKNMAGMVIIGMLQKFLPKPVADDLRRNLGNFLERCEEADDRLLRIEVAVSALLAEKVQAGITPPLTQAEIEEISKIDVPCP